MHNENTDGTLGDKRARGRGTGCLLAVVIFLSLALLVTVLGLLGMAALRSASVKRPIVGRRMGADEFPDMRETWSCGSGDTKVVAVPLQGMIMLGEEQGGMFGPAVGPADVALQSIRRATHDKDVRALILRVDSGGGGITASDILFKALADFKKAKPDRVIVAVFGDVAASGAYYVSMAADYILAHPTTLTGSIGVLIQTINARELAQKIGIRDVTIKSGANKDLLNPLGEMTPEQRAMLQELVDELHQRFVSLVARGRELPEEKVRELADGRIMSAGRALEQGLVDELGYFEDAVEKTADLLGVKAVKVYRYEQQFSFSAFLRAMQDWSPVGRLLDGGPGLRLWYRWAF
jgi:protease-4